MQEKEILSTNKYIPTTIREPIPLNFAPKIEVKPVGNDGRSTSCHADGGYIFTDIDGIQKQRKSMWDLVKKIGSNLLEGKDLVSVSLPVYLFEPRSFLHRVCDNWAFYHEFLYKAAQEKDHVKRMALVIAFSMSGLHQTGTCLKPFNPILGETYQAQYSAQQENSSNSKKKKQNNNSSSTSDDNGGALVYVEQISHHPPVTAWELSANNGDFVYTGQAGYLASIRGNALKGGQTGPHRIQFRDGCVIEYELPLFWLKGVMWGERIMEYYGVVKYRDVTNDLTCELVFHPDQKGFIRSFFQSAKTPSDTVRGEIKNSSDQILGTIDGSWLGFIDLTMNKKTERLWSISDAVPLYPTPIDDPLPSDSRWREDLRALILGREEEAQQWKDTLEDKQRKEKKWRLDRNDGLSE